MRIALDTNILVYAEGVNGTHMQALALGVIGRIRGNDLFLSVQAVGELFNVLTRKASRPRDAARAVVVSWCGLLSLIDTSATAMLAAADLASDHRLAIWDALILSAAAESRCRLLLSQALQDGFTWGGVTVANPFLPEPHSVLAEILQAEGR